MKKIFTLILSVLLLCSMASCGQKEADLSVYDGKYVCGEYVLAIDSEDITYTLSKDGRVGDGVLSSEKGKGYISFNGATYRLKLKKGELTLKCTDKNAGGERLPTEAFLPAEDVTLPVNTVFGHDGDYLNQYGEVISTFTNDMTFSYHSYPNDGWHLGKGELCDDNDGMGPYFLCEDGSRAYIKIVGDEGCFSIVLSEGEECVLRGDYVHKYMASDEARKIEAKKWRENMGY